MSSDEEAIRQVVATWMQASKAGDVETVLSLMTDDVIFLLPGQPVMRKADFAASSRAQFSEGAPQVDGHSDIQEIQISGEMAFMWSQLRVVVTPPGDAKQIVRSGPTLTIFKKQNGKWLLARDANMLMVISSQ
jgi:uncharacterized protein (TIGR02246 family)